MLSNDTGERFISNELATSIPGIAFVFAGMQYATMHQNSSTEKTYTYIKTVLHIHHSKNVFLKFQCQVFMIFSQELDNLVVTAKHNYTWVIRMSTFDSNTLLIPYFAI